MKKKTEDAKHSIYIGTYIIIAMLIIILIYWFNSSGKNKIVTYQTGNTFETKNTSLIMEDEIHIGKFTIPNYSTTYQSVINEKKESKIQKFIGMPMIINHSKTGYITILPNETGGRFIYLECTHGSTLEITNTTIGCVNI